MTRKILFFIGFMLISFAQLIFAQGGGRINGLILDEKTNEPVPFASVVIKGTMNGVIAGSDGYFKIDIKNPKTAVLVFSSVGYKDLEVPVGSKKYFEIKLSSNLVLDDVVVVGYTTRKLTATSASVAKVSSKDIIEKPTANILESVQGKVSGLQVYTSSGEPGAISSLRLHGAGSLGASSSPMYILDGVPVAAGFIQSLNPSDFESVQILKDAAATSIYGARAANGVVLITTKEGRRDGKGLITFKGQYGISSLANTDYFENLLDSEGYFRMLEEFKLTTPKNIEKLKKDFGKNNTKWYKYLYQNAPMYSGEVNFSGGKQGTSYYISGSIFDQKGLRAGSHYKKFNLRSNISSSLNSYIKIGLRSSISYDVNQTSPFARNNISGGGLAPYLNPIYSPYDENGQEYWDTPIPGRGTYNPKYYIHTHKDSGESLFTNLVGNIIFTPFKGFQIRSQASVMLEDDTSHYINYPSYIPNAGEGNASRSFARSLDFVTNSVAEYKFSLFKSHNFSLLAGSEYSDYNYESFSGSGKGLVDDRLVLLSMTTKDKDVSENLSQSALLSFFSQFSYDYAGKYFLDAVIRSDSSSKFGKNNRVGIFWSVGLLWKAKKEKFLQDVNWLDAFDVRLSIGTQGNNAISNYKTLALVGGYGQYNGVKGRSLSNPGNDNLQWEKQRKATFGVTADLFKRFHVNLELYDRLTSDMLMDVPMPYTSGLTLDQYGFASYTDNVGKYQNRGVDLNLSADILKGKDYGISAYLNYNYNKDKVLELFQGRDSWILPNYGYGYIVGEPVKFIYPIYKGVDEKTGKAEWYLPKTDENGIPIPRITQKDPDKTSNIFNDNLEQNTGINRYPSHTGGFGFSAHWKGLSLSADFVFVADKHLISNDNYFILNPYKFYEILTQSKYVFDYWKQPGDKTRLPGLEYMKNYGGYDFDTRLLSKAGFARLKTLTLSYSVPRNFLKKQNFLNSAKIYFTGRNLLTFTKYEGTDPEIDSNLSLGPNPNTKQYSIGIELSF